MEPSRQLLQTIESDVRELLRVCALDSSPTLELLDLEWIWPVYTTQPTYKDGRPLPDGHPHGAVKKISVHTVGWPQSINDALYVIRQVLDDLKGRTVRQQVGELPKLRKSSSLISRRRLERLRLGADTIRDVLKEKTASEGTLPAVVQGPGGETGAIPFANPSAPLSKKNTADAWGGDMTVKKLSKLMNSGKVKFVKLTRETFVFCRDDIPNLPQR
jgi:hypothetical protein